jgi:hypothetical protein
MLLFLFFSFFFGDLFLVFACFVELGFQYWLGIDCDPYSGSRGEDLGYLLASLTPFYYHFLDGGLTFLLSEMPMLENNIEKCLRSS